MKIELTEKNAVDMSLLFWRTTHYTAIYCPEKLTELEQAYIKAENEYYKRKG